MRFLISALLLICIVATITPCCAFDGCSEENPATADHSGDKQKSNCSPFFTCAGCATAVMTVQKTDLPVPFIAWEPPAAVHQPGLLTSYTASFWQPPRKG